MKAKRIYNRAFIIRNEVSKPILELADGGENDGYWLFQSGESFHGEQDGKFFYFLDSRIRYKLKLPIECVRLEFSKEELERDYE